MSEEKKIISRHQYLTALAIFTVASQHYRKTREMERALCEELGIEIERGNPYAHQISDAIYDDGPIGGFDQALKYAGYEVETTYPVAGMVPLPSPPVQER